MTNASKNISEYIASAPSFARPILSQLRDLVHDAEPNIEEGWKWESPCFLLDGRLVLLIWAFTHHVGMVFSQGALMKDRHKLFTDGLGNKQSRTIKFTEVGELQKQRLMSYVKEAMANARAGKRVQIPQSKDKTVILPDDIRELLEEQALLEKFNGLIYTYRKGYIQWIAEARREETRQKRMKQMITELRSGKTYMNMPIWRV